MGFGINKNLVFHIINLISFLSNFYSTIKITEYGIHDQEDHFALSYPTLNSVLTYLIVTHTEYQLHKAHYFTMTYYLYFRHIVRMQPKYTSHSGLFSVHANFESNLRNGYNNGADYYETIWLDRAIHERCVTITQLDQLKMIKKIWAGVTIRRQRSYLCCEHYSPYITANNEND